MKLALLEQIEMNKLIRSKGIESTLSPKPNGYSKWSTRTQFKKIHALRALPMTEKIKQTDIIPFLNFIKLMKSSPAWDREALVTALNEKGIPTPLAATMMRAL
jgi:hypothetical protein